MKIFVASILKWGGATGVQTHVREVFPLLKNAAIEPHFVCPQDGDIFKKIVLGIYLLIRIVFRTLLPEKEVQLYRAGHGLVLKWRLRKYLSEGAPCVIYAQCPISAQSALNARVDSHQKVILIAHFNVSQANEFTWQGRILSGGRTFNLIRAFESELIPKLDGLVFVSKFMHDELSERIPKILAVPYRIFPNFLEDPIGKSNNFAKDIDLICIGTLETRKNQRYALQIVASAHRLGRCLTLTVIGDGPDRAALEVLAVNLNIQNYVRFLGFVSQAADHMNQHRACLHVASIENLPITLIEALSRGIPIFAPAVGGIPEIFTDGIEGRMIQLDDPEKAAKLILHWFDMPGALEKAGLAARQRFNLRFRGDIVGQQLVQFLYQTMQE